MTDRDLSTWIASEIRKRRLLAGMSQQELAEVLHLERAHVTRLESGRHMPTLPTLIDYAKALGCKVSDLIPKNV